MDLRIILFLAIVKTSVSQYDLPPSAIFLRPGRYTYSYEARVDSGFSLPAQAESTFAIVGLLRVNVPERGLPITLQLDELQHLSLPGVQGVRNASFSYSRLPEQALVLSAPFQIRLRADGAITELRTRGPEPLWALNMKRALAFNLQMHSREMPGAYKVSEPCLHGTCVVEYSSSVENLIRKSTNVPTLVPTPSHRLWISVMPNVCSKDIKNPLIGNSEKWYTMDQEGMLKLESFGSIEVHYHKHVLVSTVNITLERREITAPVKDEDDYPEVVGLAFTPAAATDLTGGRAPAASRRLDALMSALASAAAGLEKHGPRDTLLKDKLPFEIYRIMSSMTFETLKATHEELDLGTSYTRETMRNIFLEALPQCTNPASALLVRDLIVQGRAGEATLQMLRKLPFGVQSLGPELLAEMAPLLKLGQEHPSEVRRAAILAHSSLVFRTFLSGACTEDTFEDMVQVYFSRFTESGDYADRLTWLMGLSNLQLQQVRTYLAPVIGGRLGHTVHERFLAAWATLPLAHLYPQEVHNLYWPILQNSLEPLEMRVAACLMLLMAEPSTHRLLSLHWYISAQPSGHLKNFFYTMVKSFQHTTYECFAHLGKLTSYVSRLVAQPETRFWATGLYMADLADVERDMSVVGQAVTVADPTTGLPNLLHFTLVVQNAGLVVSDMAVYIKLQGVAGSFLSKLRRLSGSAVRLERLVSALRDVRAHIRVPALVHAELLLKHQGKVVWASYVNQTSFDKWTNDITKVLDSFLQAESHVNQQILIYPTLLTSILPSDLGTPVQTDTMLSSLTSLRGNLTHSIAGEVIARNNDVHFRTSTLAMITLSSYNPVGNTQHVAEVAQVMDVYLPANFTLALSLPTRTFRTSWLQRHGNLGPGMLAYSAAKILWRSDKGQKKDDMTLKFEEENLKVGNYLNLNCEGATKPHRLIWQLINSHKSNAETIPWIKPFLVAIHGLALSSIPAEGACALTLVQPPGPTAEMEAELALLSVRAPHAHIKTRLIKRRASDGMILSYVNGTCLLELEESRARLVAKYVGLEKPGSPEWKMCLELEAKKSPINARLGLAMGPGSKTGASDVSESMVCPKDMELGLLLDEMETGYQLTTSAKNMPASVTSFATSASSILEPLKRLGGEQAGAGVQAGALVAHVLAVAGRSRVQEGVALGRSGGGAWLAQALAAGSALLLGPPSELRLLAQLGVIRECRITESSVVTLRGEESPMTNGNCTLLLLGDCTRSPHFALFQLPSPSGLRLRLYTGGNYADVDTSTAEISVTVNGENVEWKPSYQYPPEEKFYDFKITESNGSVLIDNNIGALRLSVRRGYAAIQLPATQLDRGCGVCARPSERFTKC